MGFACYLPSLLKGTSSHLTLTEAPSSRCHQFPASRARRQEGQRALAWSAEPEVPALGSCGGRRPAPRPYGPRRAARPGARGLRLPTPSLITAAPQLPGGHAHYLQDAAPASCRPRAFWNGSPGSEGGGEDLGPAAMRPGRPLRQRATARRQPARPRGRTSEAPGLDLAGHVGGARGVAFALLPGPNVTETDGVVRLAPPSVSLPPGLHSEEQQGLGNAARSDNEEPTSPRRPGK